jgi:hypothetical protein
LRVKKTARAATRKIKARPQNANVPRVAKTAATSAHAMTSQGKLKHLQVCLLPKRLKPTATQVQTTTVNAANAVHATVTAVTAANVEVRALIAKKVQHKSNSGLMTSLRLSPHNVAMLQ